MMKIGQSWGKLQIIPPMLNKDLHHWSRTDKIQPNAIGIYENQYKFDESNSRNPNREQS